MDYSAPITGEFTCWLVMWSVLDWRVPVDKMAKQNAAAAKERQERLTNQYALK